MSSGFWRQFGPRFRARTYRDVTPTLLIERGIKALVVDLDNTLVPWHGTQADPDLRDWVASLHGGGIRVCIVSNTHRPRRVAGLAEQLKIMWVLSGGKPRKIGFERAMRLMESQPAETAVLGDQVLTDIWGGNRCGLMTILVDRIAPEEFIATRLISRRIERYILRRIEASAPIPHLGGSEGGRREH